jgi:hypothetical protein
MNTLKRHKLMNNIIRIFSLAKEQGKLFMLDPVLTSRGSCTDNRSLSADNSLSLYRTPKG